MNKEFQIVTHVSNHVKREDLLNALVYLTGAPIVLSRDHAPYEVEEDDMQARYCLSQTIDITKDFSGENSMHMFGALSFEMFIDLKLFQKGSDSYVFIKDIAGCKHCILIQEDNFFENNNEGNYKVSIQKTDGYSLFILSNLVRLFGGTLLLNNEKKIHVSNEASMYPKMSDIEAKEMTDFLMSDNSSKKDKIMGEKIMKNQNLLFKILTVNKKDIEDMQSIYPELSVKRMQKMLRVDRKNEVMLSTTDFEVDRQKKSNYTIIKRKV